MATWGSGRSSARRRSADGWERAQRDGEELRVYGRGGARGAVDEGEDRRPAKKL
jgi:hypothetical protein